MDARQGEGKLERHQEEVYNALEKNMGRRLGLACVTQVRNKFLLYGCRVPKPEAALLDYTPDSWPDAEMLGSYISLARNMSP